MEPYGYNFYDVPYGVIYLRQPYGDTSGRSLQLRRLPVRIRETLPGKNCRAGPFRAWVTRLSNGKAVP